MNQMIKLVISVMLLMACISLSSAQSIEIRAEDGGALPINIPVGETFTVLITENGNPVGETTSVIFALPAGGDPIYSLIDENGKARYLPLITRTLSIRVLDDLVTVAEATVDVTAPTLTWQTEPPTPVEQGDEVTFDVSFSESADYYFRVENSTGGVVWRYPESGTDSAVNLTARTWATTTGTPAGDYIIIININGADNSDTRTVTVTEAGAAPTLEVYTITNTTITPPQTTSIDVRFSEQVSATIKIEDASGNLVNELYTSTGVTNPCPQIWDGTYTTGAQVPDGEYTVNVSGVSTTTGLSVIDTSKTIEVVTVEAVTVNIGSAACSVGVTVDVPISITGASNIGAMNISVTYNASILTATGVANGTMMASLPNAAVAHNIGAGWVNISFATYPEAVNGDGELFVVTFYADAAGTSVLDINVAEAWTGDEPPQLVTPVTVDGCVNVTGAVYPKGDLDHNGQAADAVDVAMMLQGSVGGLTTNPEFDLDGNSDEADAVDVAMMLQASVGDITL